MCSWKVALFLSFACNLTSRIDCFRLKKTPKHVLKVHDDLEQQTSEQGVGATGDREAFKEAFPLHKVRKGAQAAIQRFQTGVVSTLVWNVGGPQTNPFEFRTPLDDANALVDAVEEDTRTVGQVFTESMVAELEGRLRAGGTPEEQITLVHRHWQALSTRHVVNGFLLDKSLDLGNRRSVAAADMFTGTIQVETGPPAMRPAVINCGEGYDTPEDWWAAWLEFMFDTDVKTKKIKEQTKVWKLLKTIDMKYFKDLQNGHQVISDGVEWAVIAAPGENFTKGELVADPSTDPVRAQFLADQYASIPLQLLHLGIFDAITVTGMMQTSKLNSVREQLCQAIRSKDELTLGVIEKYSKTLQPDVILLTEVGFNLEKTIISRLGDKYWHAKHEDVTSSRKKEFNLILFRKTHFQEPMDAPEAGGFDVAELLMVPVKSDEGVPFLLAAFHGQSSGSTSVRAAEVIWKRAQALGAVLIAGMDANVVNTESLQIPQFAESTTFNEFNNFLAPNGLDTSSAHFQEENMDTCKKVRTVINTQLQKAVRKADWSQAVDKNPKDHTIFMKTQLEVVRAAKINTPSDAAYDQNLVFPTLQFPSDHAIVFTFFRLL